MLCLSRRCRNGPGPFDYSVMQQARRESSYRWVIVAAGGFLGCVAFGAMFSLPVFLRSIAGDTGWSITGVSAAMTIAFLAMAFGSFAWGSLSDRLGPRIVVLTGSVILAGSLALASRMPTLLGFQLAFGVLVGGATAAIFAPLMACVTGWFETRRSLAVSLVSAGMGMAPLTMSPLAAWLVTHHHWRASLLIISAIVAAIMIPVSFLIRRPPTPAATSAGAPMLSASEAAPEMSRAEALRSPQFLILLLTNFFCCAAHSGPIVHTVSYAVTCGIPLILAVSIYSVEGLAGLGGRVAFGLLGDRFGAKRILVIGLLVQALGTLGYLAARELATFYTVAAVFGFIYAGVMPLYSVIARENFPMRMMGTVIGGMAMAGGLGMATGPVVGGMIYDAFASYAWLFITCFGLGVGAFLIALTFRPFPKKSGVPVPA
jgi:MFS family permease